MLEIAPRSDWSEMCASDHFVQFYENDQSLLSSLSSYVIAGVGAGDACIVVARPGHRQRLEEKLQAYGVNLGAARASGQYRSLDASETLSKFIVDGVPDPKRFVEVIGGLVRRAGASYQRLRIYGDMVALLCEEGRHETAIRLEELWNDLGKAHSFTLFCGYSMKGFSRQSQARSLHKVCATHSAVIPAESYTELDNPDDRLHAIINLQQQAQALQVEISGRQEAESANRLKDEFLAELSYELRTPLHIILGWSRLLRGGNLDAATTSRALETIERNARIQLQLVEGILDASSVLSGKAPKKN